MSEMRTQAGKRLVEMARSMTNEMLPDHSLVVSAEFLRDQVEMIEAEAGSLDAAWAEAEAALLEGWVILGLDYGIALRGWETRASDPYEEAIPIVLGIGPTPAAALRALAAKLHGMPR